MCGFSTAILARMLAFSNFCRTRPVEFFYFDLEALKVPYLKPLDDILIKNELFSFSVAQFWRSACRFSVFRCPTSSKFLQNITNC